MLFTFNGKKRKKKDSMQGKRREERPAGDQGDEFNPKRQITRSTLHCLSLELTLQSATHGEASLSPTVPEARIHTHTHTHTHTLECREHITAAAIIKHTITVRSERLVCEREVKRQD